MDWIRVNIPYDNWPSWAQKLNEARWWCEDNFGHYPLWPGEPLPVDDPNAPRWAYLGDGGFIFQDERDATLFALRWG